MSTLTLSPDERYYAVALVVLASMSASTLAAFVHTRCRVTPMLFLPIYAAAMSVVAALALLLLGVPTLEYHSPADLALALLAGAIACLIALRVEGYIARTLRRTFAWRASGKLSTGSELVRPDLGSASSASGASVLAWLLVVAAGEEILFRGVLVDVARFASDDLIYAALLAAFTIAFALSHGQLSFVEAVNKLPLSVACLAAYLVSDTLLAPIAAHLGYNAWMWRAATLQERVLKQAAGDASNDSSKR